MSFISTPIPQRTMAEKQLPQEPSVREDVINTEVIENKLPSYPVSDTIPQEPQNPGGGPTVLPPANAGQQNLDQFLGLCDQGQHEKKRQFGPCGVLTAIACFPFGLIFLFTDTHRKCARCGVPLDK